MKKQGLKTVNTLEREDFNFQNIHIKSQRSSSNESILPPISVGSTRARIDKKHSFIKISN